MSIPPPPNVVFYTPFPEYSRQTYQLNADSIISSELSDIGLPLRYVADAKAASWKGYQNHVNELNHFKATHIEYFRNKYRKKGGIAPNFIDERYPKKPGSKPLEHYTSRDTLFIHCHGNNRGVIGTGGFILTPDLLAKNLEALGLSKKEPPIIVVWSCQSGTENDAGFSEDDSRSYAAELRKELRKAELGYPSRTGVIGIDANIMIRNGSNITDPVWFARKRIGVDGEVDYKSVSENEAVRSFQSPLANKGVPGGGGLLTNIEKLQRASNPSVMPLKPPSFNDLSSTVSSSSSGTSVRPQTRSQSRTRAGSFTDNNSNITLFATTNTNTPTNSTTNISPNLQDTGAPLLSDYTRKRAKTRSAARSRSVSSSSTRASVEPRAPSQMRTRATSFTSGSSTSPPSTTNPNTTTNSTTNVSTSVHDVGAPLLADYTRKRGRSRSVISTTVRSGTNFSNVTNTENQPAPSNNGGPASRTRSKTKSKR